MALQVKQKKQQGAALLIVIMITAIMSVIMTLMLHQSRLDMKLSALVKHRALAEVALHSSQSTFIYKMMSTPLHLVGPNYVLNGVDFETLVPDFKGAVASYENVNLSVQDLSGLVSLFPFDEKSFNRLLIENGYNSEQLLVFHDRLQDWQDADSLTRIEGKEQGDYQEYPFFPSNRQLQTVQELAYIIEPDVYRAISPWLILYGHGHINGQYAPKPLYSAAGINTKNSEEYNSFSTGEGGYSYPTGGYLVTLSFEDKGVSLHKQFLLMRGADTFQPFFVANEKIF
ncbi:hypothetical protein GCM10009111_13150 [Colwellia asteriadis]|uniref:T2SS protein K first SAM-like domain-containing protein n=1 Tax=Colwellia asteriadis TaxID=517723 RepID=A0ABN1L5J5_9GAMM